MIKKILFLLFLCISFDAFCDWGPVSYILDEHGILQPEQTVSDSVKMKTAIINIYANEFDYDLHYQCSFEFENLTGKTQNITMGFPIVLSIFTDLKLKTNTKYNPVSNFKVFNDDGTIEYSLKEKNNEQVYIIKISLKPNEIISLENSYDILYDKHIGVSVIPQSNKINYVLKTGAMWAESIGHLQINILFRNMLPEIFYCRPAPFTLKSNIEKNEVLLRFDEYNYEPSFDIDLNYGTNDTAPVLDKYLEQKNFSRLIKIIDQLCIWEEKYADFYFEGIRKSYNRFNLSRVISNEQLKNLLFRTANSFYNTDFNKAIDYYKKAFELVKDNSFAAEADLLLERDISGWTFSENAPAYFIAYNIACSYSLKGDISNAEKWLRISLRLSNTIIRKHILTDPDLANIRKNEIFSDILSSEPKKNISVRERIIQKTRQFYDSKKDNYVYNGDQRNKDSFVDVVYAVPGEIPYAVIIYYKVNESVSIQVSAVQPQMYGYKNIASSEKIYLEKGKGLLLVEMPITILEGEFPNYLDILIEGSNSLYLYCDMYKKFKN